MRQLKETLKMMFVQQTEREAQADALAAAASEKRAEASSAINDLLTELTTTKRPGNGKSSPVTE